MEMFREAFNSQLAEIVATSLLCACQDEQCWRSQNEIASADRQGSAIRSVPEAQAHGHHNQQIWPCESLIMFFDSLCMYGTPVQANLDINPV